MIFKQYHFIFSRKILLSIDRAGNVTPKAFSFVQVIALISDLCRVVDADCFIHGHIKLVF